MPLVRTGSNVGTSTSFVGDTFDKDKDGNATAVPKGVPIVIDSAQVQITNASGCTSVTWQITKKENGSIGIGDQNTDTISFQTGSTAIGSVHRDGPLTVTLDDDEDLCIRAYGNAGTFDWVGALSYHLLAERAGGS